jgi:predicted DNA binding protein
MSLVGEFHVSADDFVLAQTMAEKPALRFELERFIPTTGTVMPYLWVGGNGLHSLQTAAAADPTIANLHLIDSLNGGGLFYVQWDETHQMVTEACANGDEALVQAVGQEDEWFLKIRFGTRESLGSFQTSCDTREIDFDLLRLYDIQAPKLAQYDMSVRQRDAIVTALKLGYFEVPRTCELSDVAAELDLSVNAVSERIRRGENNMFRSALTIPRPPHRTDLQ